MALEITYWTGCAAGSQSVAGEAISSETRTVSASSAQSGATPNGAVFMSLLATENLRYAYNANPTATGSAGASGHYIASGERIWLDATPGYKVAAITPA